MLAAVALVTLPATTGSTIAAAQDASGLRLVEPIVAMARTPSVPGREHLAAAHVRELLAGLDVQTDALGSLTLTLGEGEPRRLITVPLDEPGYVVSRIDDRGNLRLTPVGQGYRRTLAHQALEGNEVTIVTGTGVVPGAVGVPSAHLTSFAREPVAQWPAFAWQDAYVDVGAAGAGEAAALGIRLMDTVTLIKRPTVMRGELVAAPSVQVKAAAVALAEAAHRIAASPGTGTTVLAWTALELLNGKGLEAVVHDAGSFDEVMIFSRNFGWGVEGRAFIELATPPLGAGVLAADVLAGTTEAVHREMFRYPYTGGPAWGEAELHFVGLPTRYQDTPVETVSASDGAALADLFTGFAESTGAPVALRAVREPAPVVREDRSFGEVAGDLEALVARYGVSGHEVSVRDALIERLPTWAEPVVDDTGNLTITFGEGDEHVMFVAHMDETGYRVREIREDGTLVLDMVGGNLEWIWESQAAVVHSAGGVVPAVFEPRLGHLNARTRRGTDDLTAFTGSGSADEVASLGVRVGDTVTMPKQMRRLGWFRAIARAFDDRAGSAALVEAARRIDPAALSQRVTFAWSVGEEVGLVGALALAERFTDISTVHPVDTFVSSDAPLESERTAYARLGSGFVIRVVESVNYTPAAVVARLQRLALVNEIPAQLGMTSGGTDGLPWVAQGIPSAPISWPGRYSHSPIEVLDFRDLDALIRMVVVLAENPAGR